MVVEQPWLAVALSLSLPLVKMRASLSKFTWWDWEMSCGMQLWSTRRPFCCPRGSYTFPQLSMGKNLILSCVCGAHTATSDKFVDI